MARVALVIGLFIALLGVLGLVAPNAFVEVVSFFQTPAIIYLASAIRVAFGVILILAASTSRAPMTLRVLGGLIAIGGLLSPFFGVRFAQPILASWSAGGPVVVRIWAAFGLLLGAFIIYAVWPRRPLPNNSFKPKPLRGSA